MLCRIYIFTLLILLKCRGFRYNVDPKLGYTNFEHIIKRGIERLCDEEAVNVLASCKRPLVRLDDTSGSYDLHTKITFVLSERLNDTLENVSARLASEIRKEISKVKDCVVSSSGYVNLILTDEFILSELDRMCNKERLGVPLMSDECVVVDYFGPNVGKDLHMGHLRSLAIGQCISNLLEFCGCTVHRRSHVGDFGAQSGILIKYLLEYDPITLESLDPSACDRERFLDDARSREDYSLPGSDEIVLGPSRLSKPVPPLGDVLAVRTMGEFYRLARELYNKDAEFAQRARLETVLLQNNKSFAQQQWDKIRSVCREHFKDILRKFGMKHLYEIPESFYYKDTLESIEQLLKKKIAKKHDDSSVSIDIDKLSSKKGTKDQIDAKVEDVNPEDLEVDDSPPNISVLRTKEGAVTYMATDIAALKHRIKTHSPNRIIYITDNSQGFHFKRLEKISESAEILKNCKIEYIGYGPVTLDDGRKLRSRTGKQLKLSTIMAEVFKKVANDIIQRGDYLSQTTGVLSKRIGTGSMIYAELSTKHHHSYRYSLDRLLNQGGNSLIAILYSYVRARSIEKKASNSNFRREDTRGFRNKYERQLGLRLLSLENVIYAAMNLRAPHRLCKYLFTLSKEFSDFYQHTRVIEEDGEIIYSQSLKLVSLTASVIQLVLTILNIRTVEEL